MSELKEPFSLKKRVRSFKFAVNGLSSLVREEHNSRIHLFATGFVIVSGLFLRFNLLEWLAVIFCIALVFILELVNSALEKVCDTITRDINTNVKMAKDYGAAAVFVGALFSTIVYCVIIYNKST